MLLAGTPIPLGLIDPFTALTSSSDVVYSSFALPGQTRSFEVEALAGQRVAVALEPLSGSGASIVASASLSDGTGILDSSGALGPGGTVLLEALVTQDGTLQLNTTNFLGVGSFSVQTLVGGIFESESVGLDTNDGFGTAQSLDSDLVALPGGIGGRRATILGELSAPDSDYYHVTLTAGQAFRAALQGDSSTISLELLDAAGNLLVSGGTGAGLADAWIDGFSAPEDGDYFLRVGGRFYERYTLLAAVDASLAVGLEAVYGRQSLTPSVPMIGQVRFGGGTFGIDAFNEPNDTTFDAEFLDFNAATSWFVDGEIGDNFNLSDPGADVDLFDLGFLSEGSTLTINLDADINGSFLDAALRLFDSFGDEVEFSDDDPAPGEPDSADPYLEIQIPYGDTYYIGVSDYDNTGYDIFSEDSGFIEFGSTGEYTLEVSLGGGANTIEADVFDLHAEPGDELAITVAELGAGVPGAGAGFSLDLYNRLGVPVASASVGAGGAAGKTILVYNVPAGHSPEDAFTVRVNALAEGAFALSMDGSTATAPSWASGLFLPVKFPNELPDYVSFPGSGTLILNRLVDPSSLGLADLSITGPGGEALFPSSATITNGNQIRFEFLNANVGDGLYELNIADGALTDISGQPIDGTTRSFDYRQEGVRVISSTLSDGDVLAPGGLDHTVEFSEPLLQIVSAGLFGFIVLNGDDVELKDLLTGEVSNPLNFGYTTNPTTQISTTFAHLDEGVYELRYLASKPGGFDSEVHIQAKDDGFPLDGSPSNSFPSGDGQLGDDFVIRFSVDRDALTPLGPWAAIGPAVGQVYTTAPLRAAIGEVGDVDTFTIEVDAGQTLSLRLDTVPPSGDGLQARVRVIDPAGTVLVDQSALGEGMGMVTAPVSLPVGGVYTIEVTGVSGVGGYEMQAYLNAAQQSADASSETTAQRLDTATRALGGQTASDRMAVVGMLIGSQVSMSQTIEDALFSPNALDFEFAAGADPLGPVSITFDADNAQLFGESQFLTVTLEGLGQRDLFINYANRRSQTLVLTAAEWRTLTADGRATIRVKPSAAVTGANPVNTTTAMTLTVEYAAAGDPAFYRVGLAAGQGLDLSASGHVAFELLGPSGQLLAASATVDGRQALSGFAASQTGDYTVRLVGDGDYTLVAMRNLAMDTPVDSTPSLPASTLIGSLVGNDTTGRVLRVAHLGETNPPGGSGNDPDRLINQLNDSSVFTFDAVRLTAADLIIAEDLAAFDVIVTAGVSELRRSDSDLAELLKAYVQNGGGLVLVGGAVFRTTSDISFQAVEALDDVSPIALDSSELSVPNAIDILDDTHPITRGLDDFATDYFTTATQRGGAVGKPGSVVLGQSGGGDTVAYRNVGVGGRSVFLGPLYDAAFFTSGALRAGAPDQLLEQAVAWAAEAGDRQDAYRLDLAVGQTITIQTQAPVAGPAGPGDPSNNLDPQLVLLGPDGQPVAGDQDGLDGLNAELMYTVPVGGAGEYTVLISGQGADAGVGSGVYVLSVTGIQDVAADTTGPSVIDSVPADTSRLGPTPTRITLRFDEALDLTTVAAEDLTIDGGATVTGVEIVDGKTLRFLVDVPDAAGVYSYTLAEGSVRDLSGNGNAAFTAGFEIDRTGPRVIAQSPGVQAAAPFGQIALTFSESLDPDSVSIQNIQSFTAPDGSDLLPFVTSVSVAGDRVEIRFTQQLALGNYTLVFGPNLTDTAGQLMDQDQSGTGGEASDVYTATLSIQTPNLTVQSVTPGSGSGSTPGNAPVFGSPFAFSYTVANNGTDDAVEGWVDRVYLSLDGEVNRGDVLLATIESDQEGFDVVSPLAHGDQYTRDLLLNLPLRASLDAGAYRLIVVTDYFNNQPEDTESDNLLATDVLQIALPPLPDLTVPTVSLPISPQESGGPIELTWTLANEGDGAFTGTVFEDVYLSQDATLSKSADRYLGRFGFTGTIDAGASVQRIQSVAIAIDAAGDFYLIVDADPNRAVFEHAHEDNNTGVSATALELVLPPLPDLVVTAITAPATALSNELVTVGWTIENIGPGDWTGRFTEAVSLSADGLLGGDQSLESFQFDGFIPAGGSVTRSANVQLPADLSGDRFFVVEADTTDRVFEDTGEGNNAAIDDNPVAVTRSPFPNLQVTLVTAPPVAFSGESFDVTWRVRNTGDAPTNAATWFDGLYLSTNGVVDGLDSFLGQIQTPAFLNPGEAYEQTLTVTVPRGVQGPRFVLVLTDTSNRVFELGNENDNVAASSELDVQLTPPPDLQTTNVDAPPAAFSGQGMTLRWTVTNEGLGRTLEDRWFDRVWLSADEVLDNQDISLGFFEHNEVLEAGASYLAEEVVTLPIGLTGEFFFLVETDVFGQVFEFAFEGNNRNLDPGTTNILLTPPPDLVVKNLSVPADSEAGRNALISYRVDNDGATVTPNETWTDIAYLSQDDTLDRNQAIRLGTFQHRGALEPGEGYEGVFNVRLPDGLVGDYTVFVVTDDSNVVFELDNANNLDGAPTDIVLNPPDLIVTTFEAPDNGVAGDGLPVRIVVENLGTGTTTVTKWRDRIYIGGGDDLTHATLLFSIPRDTTLDMGLAAGAGYEINLSALPLPLSLSPGDYNLFFVADTSGQVFEGSEENNLVMRPITIARQTPDLVVESITPIASAFSGQPVEIEWTVRNQGGRVTNASTWDDAVYLSADPTLGGATDILLGRVQRTNPLGPGASYTRKQSFEIPAGLTGDFYIIVETDERNRVFEPSAVNNNVTIAGTPTAFAPAPAPDLVVENVDAPDAAFSGRVIRPSWTLKNDGTASVQQAIYQSVYLSADRLLDSSDTLIGTQLDVVSLAPGQTVEFDYTANRGLPVGVTGSFYVLVRTDATDRVYEGEPGELNNVGFDDDVLTIDLAPPVDLVAGVVNLPADASAGQIATISYTVSNAGPNAAIGPWTDTLYISSDPVWDVGDKRFAEVERTDTVLGGQSYTGTAIAPLPGLVPGDYYVIVRSDIRNQVVETDETNNLSATIDAFGLDIPALALDTPTPVQLVQGRFTYFRLDLPDDQTFIVDVDTGGHNVAVELFARLGDVPARDRFDFTLNNPLDINPRLVVPDTQDGAYYIGLFGASVEGGVKPVTVTARLVPFSITDTDYGVAGNAGDRTLQINGARFDRTVTATLITGSGQERAATAIYPVHEARVYATFDLRGLAPGAYDIRIDKADGSSDVLPDALEVVAGGGGTNTPRLIGPTGVGIATQLFPVTAGWGNDGLNDALAPLLYIEASNLIGDLGGDRTASFTTFLGAGLDDGPVGILRPDQASSRPLASSFAGIGVASSTTIIDRLVQDPTQPYDWSQIKPTLPQLGLAPDRFEAAFEQMVLRNGSTWGDYLSMLSRNATLITQPWGDARNLDNLHAMELLFAAADLGDAIWGRLNAPDFEADISGVKVSIGDIDTGNGYTFHSFSDGSFVMIGLEPGTYEFAAEGVRLVDPPTVSLAAGQVVRDVILDAVPGIKQATGRVLDGLSGEPLASIFLDFYQDGELVNRIATDSAGQYDAGLLPPGTYSLRIPETDLYARTLREEFVVGPGVETPDIIVSRASEVGSALAFSVEHVTSPDSAEVFVIVAPDLSQPTDDYFIVTTDNQVTLEGLSAGTYTIWVFTNNSAQKLENVVIGDAGLVDLGVVRLGATPIEPVVGPAVPVGFSVVPVALIGTPSGFVSTINTEKSFAHTGGPKYPTLGDETTVGLIEEGLERIETTVRIDWLQASLVKWGVSHRGVWSTYLDTDSSNPSPRITFGDFSDIVNGSWVANGFREQSNVQSVLGLVENAARRFFQRAFSSGEITPEQVQAFGQISVPINDIPQVFASTNGAQDFSTIGYSNIFDIPGNLAGGGGTPGTGTGTGGGRGQVFTDIRELKGFATLIPVGRDSVRVEYFVYFSAADTVDFEPGNPGEGPEQVVTRRLWALELFDKAFDVPFIAEYDTEWKSFTITRTPGDPASPDGPPDFVLETFRRRSGDPNDILGPEGFGPEKLVPADTALDYTIRFENDPDLADAPAQEIIITSPLDPDLDPRTFRLGDIQLSETYVDVPEGRAFYQTRLDLRETRGVFVDLLAGVDLEKNEAFWIFTSIDPETGELPFDPLKGLLPVNDDTGIGEGSVQYSVLPKQGAQTGDVIDAQATIVFDVNGPIDTPAIFNTLDAIAPTSQVDPLPAVSQDESFTVSWSGSDNADGSGVAAFDIYVSVNGGAFERWLTGTELTSAVYPGRAGERYGFYAIARDNAGNTEPAKDAAEASVMVTGVLVGNPLILSVFVNGEEGEPQRSQVDTIGIRFDRPVTLGSDPAQLLSAFGGAQIPISISLSEDRRVMTLAVPEGGLLDGEYRLWVRANQVTDDAGKPMIFDSVRIIHRLFGDLDGDGDVDGRDINRFRRAAGGGEAYALSVDVDRDGDVDAADYLAASTNFDRRFPLSFPGPLASIQTVPPQDAGMVSEEVFGEAPEALAQADLTVSNDDPLNLVHPVAVSLTPAAMMPGASQPFVFRTLGGGSLTDLDPEEDTFGLTAPIDGGVL